jgi:ubiquinone/menaquinone biosynthesis C-methylase UbiE
MPSVQWSGYDEIADVYASVAERPYFAEPARDLASLLDYQLVSRVLDIGTGSGAVAGAVREAGEARVVGIDPAVFMLRLAHGRASGIAFAAAALPELPFRSETFDAATLGFVLSHISDTATALTEVRRILKRSGQIVISAWAVSPAESAPGCAWQEVAHQFVAADELQQATSRYLPSEQRLSSPDGTIEILREGGFEDCRAEPRSYRIVVTTDEYIDARLVSLSSRYLHSNLPPDEWIRFVAETRTALKARFGEVLSFESSVNLAVARR